jgi:hypothetical protein
MDMCDENKKASDYSTEDSSELECIKKAIQVKKDKIESMINTNINISELNKNTKSIYVNNFYYVSLKSVIFLILGYYYYLLLK